MPASSSGNDTRPDYQLKHRITGAIFLMVLAVVVIPILLSEPSLEANNNIAAGTADKKHDFKSRIVPLNINNVNRQSDSIETATATDSTDHKRIENTRPALLDLTNSAEEPAGNPESGTGKSSAVVLTVEDKPASKPAASSAPAEQEETESPEQADAVTEQEDQSGQEVQVASAAPTSKDTKDTRESSDNASKAKTVKDGWVVRVGTYSKDSNVVSVSSLLTNSGYMPKKTSVSTSLGPSTRVWLGPFAKRETADAISVKLKSLTGEKGYVTRSSS